MRDRGPEPHPGADEERPAPWPEREASAAPDVTYREMLRTDIPAGLALCRASGWNQTARDWEQFLALEPHGARVALRGGGVIGTVATVRYEDRFAWLGMVLVNPAERGRGVGTELLRKGLDVLEDMRCVRLDATPAGHGLYLKLDFQDEYGLARMERRPSPEVPHLEGSAARPMTAQDLPAVNALDRAVFGAGRPAMLEWLWAGAPEYAWVIAVNGTLGGYSLGRRGFVFEHVGPVVAEDLGNAQQLTSACLASARGRPLILDASRGCGEWLRWLESVGFREQRPFLRMYLGENVHPGLPDRQFAILGPEFG